MAPLSSESSVEVGPSPTGPSGRRPGRRPGRSSSRDDILAAARALFGERGYDKASIRAIAGEAQVDPALVHHFFGTKADLFTAAIEVPIDPKTFIQQVLDGPREEIGERVVRTFLGSWEDPRLRSQLAAVIRSAATSEAGARLFRDFLSSKLVAELKDALDLPSLNLNAAASQVVGVVMLRYVLEVEPVASATDEELVALFAPTIQSHLGVQH